MKLLFGNKLLNLIDRHRLINRSSCTDILAAPVADGAADSRERIFRLNQLQRIHVFAL